MTNGYLNNDTKIPYVCGCGTKSEITWHGFRIGQRCRKCKDVKQSKMMQGNKFAKDLEHTEEARFKMSKAKKGKAFTETHRNNLSKSLKKHSTEFSRRMIERNKGRILSLETRQKISEANTGRKQSEETRRKNSESTKKYWMKIPQEQRSTHMQKAFRAAITSNPSSIEFAIRKVLENYRILYEPQKQIGRYYPDIVITNENIIIECDGDYWHNLPGKQELDAQRDEWLEKNGYKVIRIRESDIRRNPEEALITALQEANIENLIV